MNHPQIHDLTALAYNMVEGAEREQLLEHVSQCDACREIYDSYMEEQALVRDTLFRDARSGPAEARALEKTLRALADADTQAAPAQGARIYRLVTWKLVAQVAAVLVVALGLLVFLKPPAKPGADELIAIAPEQQAPGRVVSGELMVPSQGQWQRADAVPANEWVMSAGNAPLTLSFPGGATASLDPQAVFRLSTEEGQSQPVLYMLHGNGSYTAGNQPDVFCMRWGGGEFVPMAGAQIHFDARYADAADWQADANNLRGWMSARSMNVQVTDGKGVFLPMRGGTLPGVLVAGEGLQSAPNRARVLREDKRELELVIELEVNGADAMREFDFLRLRMADLKTGNAQMDKDLRLRLERAQGGLPHGTAQKVFVRAVNNDQRKTVRRASARYDDNGLQVLVDNDGDAWSVTVIRLGEDNQPEITEHSGKDVNALRNALATDARKLFDEAVETLNQKPEGK